MENTELNLFDLLAQEEKDAMVKYITSYATGGSMDCSLGHILRYWKKNKLDLYKAFGNQFIIKREINVEKSKSQLNEDIADMFNNNPEARQFKRNFTNFFENYTATHDNLTFSYWDMTALFDYNDLAYNEYTGSKFSMITPEEHKITVLKGCRPVKMLGKIADAFGIEGYEAFRLAHSLATNQRTLKGTLCLSIHPLDYMTMSDNDSGWSSCMSWQEGGCYCRGTVEMMNSTSVVVAYLESENPMSLYNMKWSNKKWRQLFVVTDDFLFGIKAYPYQNMKLSAQVIELLSEILNENKGISYTAPFELEHEQDVTVGDDIFRFSLGTNTMYNDCGSVRHVAALNKNCLKTHVWNTYDVRVYNDKFYISHNYSGPEMCMKCGSTDSEFDGEGALICYDCDDSRYCDCCGDRYCEDELQELDGEYLCDYCWDRYAVEDPITGEYHHEDNFKYLYIVPDGYVDYCINNGVEAQFYHCTGREVYKEVLAYPSDYHYSLEKYFNDVDDIHCYRSGWGKSYYVNYSDVTERAFDEIFSSGRDRNWENILDKYSDYISSQEEEND